MEVARASINQAKSAGAQVDAVIAKNKAEYERQQDLLPKKATSQKALERAQAMYDVSLEEKKVAEAGSARPRRTCLSRRRRWPKPRPSSAPWAKRIRNFGWRSPPSGRPS